MAPLSDSPTQKAPKSKRILLLSRTCNHTHKTAAPKKNCNCWRGTNPKPPANR